MMKTTKMMKMMKTTKKTNNKKRDPRKEKERASKPPRNPPRRKSKNLPRKSPRKAENDLVKPLKPSFFKPIKLSISFINSQDASKEIGQKVARRTSEIISAINTSSLIARKWTF